MQQTKIKLALAGLTASLSALFLTSTAVLAACPTGMEPDITAVVWLDGQAECASVTLNGKEILGFRGCAQSAQASGQAEELAEKLELLIDSQGFDAGKLVPAPEAGFVALRLGDKTVLSIAPQGIHPAEQEAFKCGWIVANRIREALGAPALPESFLTSPPELRELSVGLGNEIEVVDTFSGSASWYGPRFHGRRCSDGSRFDMNKLTAAHRTLPFGTKLLVKNRRTGDTCIVEVNDRGPYVGNRVLDLSRAAAGQLKMIGQGVALVDCMILGNAK